MERSAETKKENPGEKRIRGCYRKVAVCCWFTSTGRAIPKMLKYEDEEGVRHTIEYIQVISGDQESNAGALLQRYDCRAEMGGRFREFMLLYHPRENTWDMVV